MALLACILGLLTFAVQGPQPARMPPDPIDVALAELVDAPTPAARRALLATLARAQPPDLHAWLAAMRGFGSFASVPAGIRVEQAELQVLDKREKTELWIYTPAGYDAAKPAPLMLAFHGTGGSGEGMHHLWQKTADELGMLVLCPSEAGANDGYHFSDRERAAALAALRWMRRHHNVDENRVFASGISRGGHLSWDLALRYPDLFAAIVPMIGSPRLTLVAGQNNMRLLENVASLSIRDLQGSKDDKALVYSVRLAFDLLGRFAPRDAKLLEFPDRGHDFDFSAVDWIEYLKAGRRDPWPERCVRCTATKDEARAYWLEITGLGKDVQESFAPKIPQNEWLKMDEDAQRRRFVEEAVKRNARAVAIRTGPGAFSVELDGATKVRLYLRSEDLQPDGSVHVRLGGKSLERKSHADLRAMLEDFAERFDRTALVQGYVELP